MKRYLALSCLFLCAGCGPDPDADKSQVQGTTAVRFSLPAQEAQSLTPFDYLYKDGGALTPVAMAIAMAAVIIKINPQSGTPFSVGLTAANFGSYVQNLPNGTYHFDTFGYNDLTNLGTMRCGSSTMTFTGTPANVSVPINLDSTSCGTFPFYNPRVIANASDVTSNAAVKIHSCSGTFPPIDFLSCGGSGGVISVRFTFDLGGGPNPQLQSGCIDLLSGGVQTTAPFDFPISDQGRIVIDTFSGGGCSTYRSHTVLDNGIEGSWTSLTPATATKYIKTYSSYNDLYLY